jgi:hypothetical protein
MNTEAGTTMDAARIQEELLGTIGEILTAGNMQCWMMNARVMYALTEFCLNRWSPHFRRSEKKLNLTNYWVQLILYTPALALVLWTATAVHSDDLERLELGLAVFSHIALFLLAMYSMEIILRGHVMHGALLLHHLLLLVITLYVTTSEDPTVEDPRDLLDFGLIEAIGALTEQPTLVALIYYRYFSDSPAEEKDSIRSSVAGKLKLSLFTFALLKCTLFVVSFAWYRLRFDDISGSNLVWILPVLRAVHTPTLLWSFHVQRQLCKRVAESAGGENTSRTLEDAEDVERVEDQQAEGKAKSSNGRSKGERKRERKKKPVSGRAKSPRI